MAGSQQHGPAITRRGLLMAVQLIMCVLLILFWSVPLCGQGQNDAGCGGDAGDAEEDAYVLDCPGTWSGSLGDSDKDDWYAIDVHRGTILSVCLSFPDSIDLDLTIDPVGAAKLYRHTDGFGIDEVLEPYAPENPGLCYLHVHVHRVQRPYNQVCDYTLSVETQQQDDAGTATDAWDSRSQADVVLLPGTYGGTLLSSDDADWYIVDFDQGQLFTVRLTFPSDADFHLRSPTSPYSCVRGDQEEVSRYVATGAPQHVGVQRLEGSGHYELSVEVENQNDAGTGGDAFPIGHASHHVDSQIVSYGISSHASYGEFMSPARHEADVLVVPPGDYEGFLATGDEADWYAVEVVEDDTLTLDLSVPEGARMRLRIFAPGAGAPCDGGVFGSGDHIGAVERHITRTATWFFEVGLIHGLGTYGISVGTGRAMGDSGSHGDAVLPIADGVSIPYLRKDPSVGSGSTCRGACGGGCPDTCQDRPDIVRCIPAPNDTEAHVFVRYANVIECGTHQGCRFHDDCFDDCYDEYGETSVTDPCHNDCSAVVVDIYGPLNGASWWQGYGPYDGYYLYSDSPVASDPEPGRLESTEYLIDVDTGDIAWTLGEGTDARVYLTLIGTHFGVPRCSSAEIRLDTPDCDEFESGEHNSFVVSAEAFDSLEGVVLRHDNTGTFPGWYVKQVRITDLAADRAWRANADRWIALDEEDSRLRVEFTVSPIE